MDKKTWKYFNKFLNEDLLKNDNKEYILQPFQLEILKLLLEKYNTSNKFLVEMSPGTGKTIILIAALKLLLESNLVNKVIILVDRKILGEQLYRRIIELIPGFSVCKDNNYSNERIYISTVQKLSREDNYLKMFNNNDFDLTVFFEINQYISGTLQQIGNYFTGYKLGILDPLQFIIYSNLDSFDNSKINDTYSFFDRMVGNPDYIYSLSNAVNDGILRNPIYNFKSIEIGNKIFDQIIGKLTYVKKNTENAELISEIEDISILIDNVQYKTIENKDLVEDFFKYNITKNDIEQIGYKKKQLDEFKKLLYDDEYFNCIKQAEGGNEKVWQNFFELNPWIFGYGLNFIFSSALGEKKLEQVISGFNFNDYGKRVDALMATRGIINSLIFTEIKCHDTKLLVTRAYRDGCWQISDELSGAVSQIQKTVQKAIKTLKTRIDLLTSDGDPTGESVYLYQPKSYIIIGNLNEFTTEHGINEDKFSSFELFRRNLSNPEIITYDELYNRAQYIVGITK